MNNAATATAEAPRTSTPSGATAKVSLIEMIMTAEAEAERLEIWTREVRDNDAKIAMARRAHIQRMIVRTLDLVRDNEVEFLNAVRTAREVRERAAPKAKAAT